MGLPTFEYDPAKSAANKAKHGIDFEEAQALWRDGQAVELRARQAGEERYLVIGRIANRVWAAIITYRDGVIRLISVRRARQEERQVYESQGN